MKMFIPEQYVHSRDILVDIPGHGLGILVTVERLRDLLSEGLVHPDVVRLNLMKVVYEH